MARWDIAEWVGPTPNRTTGGMVESRGLVIHIMQGSYDGSIAWGKNPASSVSFHFATRGDGHIGQLVDTADAAWTQANGNGHWISVENEGYSGTRLTDGQVDAVARIYARGVQEYGWPLQITDSPTGRGLGWHGMGGTAWGGHFDCPGEPIKAQRGEILARATAILAGHEEPDQGGVDMLMVGQAGSGESATYWLGDGFYHRQLKDKYTADNMIGALKLNGQPNAAILNYGNATTVEFVKSIVGPTPYVAAPSGDRDTQLLLAAINGVPKATADEIAADPERDGADT